MERRSAMSKVGQGLARRFGAVPATMNRSREARSRAASIAHALRSACVALLALATAPFAWAGGPQRPVGPSIALYYGEQPPVGILSTYDIAVVEPDSGFSPRDHMAPCPRWFAYASVGEVTPQRAYYADLPQRWLLGSNSAWASHVVDQSEPDWPAFFVRHVIDPLWARGYRGFFLDTLDSYQLVAKTEWERTRQREGLIRVIRAIKARHRDAYLILNRGFELLPELHGEVGAVAFESLFSGWDQTNARYVEVPQADRDWLLAQAREVRDRYGLPVISIDYCAPDDDACARSTAEGIAALGIVPYVTDGALQTVRPAVLAHQTPRCGR